MKSTALITLALVAALSLSACGGDDEAATKEPAATTSAAPSPAAETTGVGTISPSLPAEPEFEVKPQGVISDITVDACDTTKGAVAASGTARNTGKFERDLVIIISWAAPSGGDVLARGITQIENMAPGASADWQVSADLAGDDQVTCVPTAYAGQLKAPA